MTDTETVTGEVVDTHTVERSKVCSCGKMVLLNQEFRRTLRKEGTYKLVRVSEE